jgi:hypothetical protein
VTACRIEAEELTGPPQLGHGFGVTAFVLEHQYPRALEVLEQARELAGVEAAIERVVGDRRVQVDALAEAQLPAESPNLVHEPRAQAAVPERLRRSLVGRRPRHATVGRGARGIVAGP